MVLSDTSGMEAVSDISCMLYMVLLRVAPHHQRRTREDCGDNFHRSCASGGG